MDGGERLLEVAQRPARRRHDRLSGARQSRTAAHPVKQLHAEFPLEVLYGQAQRRLRDVERGGRVRERAVVCDGEEVLEAPSVDRASLSDTSEPVFDAS